MQEKTINEFRKNNQERERKVAEMENMMKEEKKMVRTQIDKMTLMIEEVKSREEANRVEEPEEEYQKQMKSFPKSSKGRQQVEGLNLSDTGITKLP